MKSCNKYMEMMSEALDNRLKGKKLNEFYDHINSCPNCKEEFESLKSLVSQLNTLPEIEVPQGFHEKTMSRIKLEAVTNSGAKKPSFAPLFERISAYISELKFGRMVPAMSSAFACFVMVGLVVSVLNNFNYSMDTGMGTAPAAATSMVAASAAPEAAVNMAAQVPAPAAMTVPEATPELYAGTAAATPTAGAEIFSRQAPLSDSQTSVPESGGGVASAKSVIGETTIALQSELEAPAGVPTDNVGRYADGGFLRAIGFEGVTTKNATIRIEVEDAKAATSFVRGMGWDITSISAYDGRANFSLKVANYDYDFVKENIRSMGKVLSESEYVIDFTDSTYDYAVSYAAKLVESERLYGLMEQAESIEDIIKLEERLSSVISIQEVYKGDFNSNMDAGDHCNLNVEIITKVKYEEYRPKTFAERLNEAFIDSINISVNVFEGIAVIGSALLPPVVLVEIIVIIILFMRKAVSGRRRK